MIWNPRAKLFLSSGVKPKLTGVTMSRRLVDVHPPNPWPPSTDEWHLHNLRGNAWGHVEESYTDDRGFYAPALVYSDEMFELTKEDAYRGRDKQKIEIPIELLIYYLNEDLFEELDLPKDLMP